MSITVRKTSILSTFAAAALVLASAHPATAQTRADLERCRAIAQKDREEGLLCFGRDLLEREKAKGRKLDEEREKARKQGEEARKQGEEARKQREEARKQAEASRLRQQATIDQRNKITACFEEIKTYTPNEVKRSLNGLDPRKDQDKIDICVLRDVLKQGGLYPRASVTSAAPAQGLTQN